MVLNAELAQDGMLVTFCAVNVGREDNRRRKSRLEIVAAVIGQERFRAAVMKDGGRKRIADDLIADRRRDKLDTSDKSFSALQKKIEIKKKQKEKSS